MQKIGINARYELLVNFHDILDPSFNHRHQIDSVTSGCASEPADCRPIFDGEKSCFNPYASEPQACECAGVRVFSLTADFKVV